MATITELARTYDVKTNTIRRWCSEFAEFLSEDANPPKNQPRIINDDDAMVLALIGKMRSQNADYETIRAALAAGDRASLPPQYEDEGQQNPTAIVTQLTAQLANAHGRITAIEQERNRLLGDREKLENELREALAIAAKLEGKLEILQQKKPGFFARLFGGE